VEHPVLRPSHRYPMLRAGGLFLILIGVGLIGAIAFSGDALINYNVFFAGAAAGIVSLFFAGRLSTGRPTRLQVLALAAAILLEGLLFVAMGRTLPPGTAEHVRWLWASAIVGVHFLPMSICFGPRFAVLGVACIANAALGLLASAVPYEFFGLVDGALKVGFGIVSFLDS
jgi:Family of unknown function (DUF6609)